MTFFIFEILLYTFGFHTLTKQAKNGKLNQNKKADKAICCIDLKHTKLKRTDPMALMNEEIFSARIRELTDESDLDESAKRNYALLATYAFDSDKMKHLIYEYIQQEEITLKSLADYILSIVPRVGND